MEGDPLADMDFDALADEMASGLDANSIIQWINGLRLDDTKKEEVVATPALATDLEAVAKKILQDGCKVVTMSGAGTSTSAGIPDFRTPGTGLYDNLAKYQLPYAQAIFEIRYFRQNPEPFYELAKEMYPGRWRPTPTHYFVRLLEEKGKLLMHWTQNIDTLERVAGISPDKMVEAHGSFGAAGCIDCDLEVAVEEVERSIFGGDAARVPRCSRCDGLVKPKITFFGENLPDRFFQNLPLLAEADVLLVMGTSLAVHPFASLVDRAPRSCPRVLLNRELVGPFARPEPRDVFLEGDCDAGVQKLVELLGWEKEFADVQERGRREFEAAREKDQKM